ncbi:MAG: hypothetical protein PF569_10155 [Candidatus Woesearchaeota archaeon]|jgi:hypothetical protein|nr:hypothetical protein [Candidatus Woesearchaeota archaeon]
MSDKKQPEFSSERTRIISLLEKLIGYARDARGKLETLTVGLEDAPLKNKYRQNILNLDSVKVSILKECTDIETASVGLIGIFGNIEIELTQEHVKKLLEVKSKSAQVAFLIKRQISESFKLRKLVTVPARGIGHAAAFADKRWSESLSEEAARGHIPEVGSEEIPEINSESVEDVDNNLDNEKILKEINSYIGLLKNFNLSINNDELNKLFKPNVLLEIRETIISTCRAIIEIKNKSNHDIKPGQVLTQVMTAYFILEGFNDIINNKLDSLINKNIRGIGANEFIGNIFYFAILKNKFSKLVNDVFEVSIDRYSQALEKDSTITSITRDDIRYQLTLMLNDRFNIPIFKSEKIYADKLANPEKHEKKVVAG